MVWMINYIYRWIYQPCTNLNEGLTKPPLKLGYGWVIIFHCFVWMESITNNHEWRHAYNVFNSLTSHERHRMCFESPATQLSVQWLVPANSSEIIKAPHHWSIVRKPIGDPWIPSTKGQWFRKRSHAMSSLCCRYTRFYPLYFNHCQRDTLHSNDVIITSKWRRFGVITTLLLRHVFSGYEHSIPFD